MDEIMEKAKLSTEDLLKMQKEIKEAKERELTLNGNLETVEKSMFEKGCATIEEAREKVKDMTKTYSKLSDELTAGTQEAKEAREWKTV